MTKQELLNLEHLAIAEEVPNMFIHIKTENSWVIAQNINKEHMENYSGTTDMYCPIKEDSYPDYSMITLEQHNIYKEEAEKAREEMEKAREEKLNNNLNKDVK